MSEPLYTRPGMRMLTPEEMAEVYEKMMCESYYWQVTPEDTPDRHKDYLPLNLWDDTQD